MWILYKIECTFLLFFLPICFKISKTLIYFKISPSIQTVAFAYIL